VCLTLNDASFDGYPPVCDMSPDEVRSFWLWLIGECQPALSDAVLGARSDGATAALRDALFHLRPAIWALAAHAIADAPRESARWVSLYARQSFGYFAERMVEARPDLAPLLGLACRINRAPKFGVLAGFDGADAHGNPDDGALPKQEDLADFLSGKRRVASSERMAETEVEALKQALEHLVKRGRQGRMRNALSEQAIVVLDLVAQAIRRRAARHVEGEQSVDDLGAVLDELDQILAAERLHAEKSFAVGVLVGLRAGEKKD
jgi:hypothetical protein